MSGESTEARTSYRVVAWAGPPPPASAEVPLLPHHGMARDAIPSLEPAADYARDLAATYPSSYAQVVRRHFRRVLHVDTAGEDLSAAYPTRRDNERNADDVRWYVWCGKRQYVATTYSDAAIEAYRFNDTHHEEVEIWEGIFTDIAHFHGDQAIWFRGELTADEWAAAFPGRQIPPQLLSKNAHPPFTAKTRPASLRVSPEVALQILDAKFANTDGYDRLDSRRRRYTYPYSAGDKQGRISEGMVSATFTVTPSRDGDPDRALLHLTYSTDLSQFHNPGQVRQAFEDARETEAHGMGNVINEWARRRGGFGMDGPG